MNKAKAKAWQVVDERTNEKVAEYKTQRKATADMLNRTKNAGLAYWVVKAIR